MWISGGGRKQEEEVGDDNNFNKIDVEYLIYQFLLKLSLNRRFKEDFHKIFFEKMRLFIKLSSLF